MDGKPTTNGNKKNDLAQQYGGSHTGGWVARLPAAWIPFVQLARLSPPAGLFLIYLPHFFGILHAAIIQRSSLSKVLQACLLCLGGSFFLSNAAHAWNDIVDSPIDKAVARTSKRPIPRGAISPRAAFIFTLTQAAGAAVFLLPLPRESAFYALAYIGVTMYYPWAKRHTNLAQFVLGFCLAWGVFMGSSAIGFKPFNISKGQEPFWVEGSSACLFLACILWTVIYDTIYAHQDIRDDTKLGLKSLAVLFRERTKSLLWLLLCCMLTLLVASGKLAGMGPQYFVIAVGGCLSSLGMMIHKVELRESSSCWWWFRYGFWLAECCFEEPWLVMHQEHGYADR
ncbi:4-hydroxybenzoate polyprenyltransferase, mitochondrial [Lachnellula occidentalis]|uniref:4-hydroxybenzoate polyprenyltransferase, mitochondrial n=1 Tax=Lachnellula occidentalis TaxID=215460 RepID=A0A8H8U2T2_9HELO|nr:4-hydroxybenzoate polyprenyltransferase, mitochondrial [Lachnellula occidentalis]